jgi:hypothetical protein
MKRAVSVGQPIHITIDSHHLTLLPTGAELVGCAVCGGGGGNKKEATAAPKPEAQKPTPGDSGKEEEEEEAEEEEGEDETEIEETAAALVGDYVGFSAVAWTQSDIARHDLWEVSTRLKDLSQGDLEQRWRDQVHVITESSRVILDPSSKNAQKRTARRRLNAAWKKREALAGVLKKKYKYDIESPQGSSGLANETQEGGEDDKKALLTRAMPPLILLSDVQQVEAVAAATSSPIRPMPSLVPLSSVSSLKTAQLVAASSSSPAIQSAVKPMPPLVPLKQSHVAAAATAAAASSPATPLESGALIAPSPLATEFGLFGPTTFQKLDSEYAGKDPWQWMREFVPESGDLCVFYTNNDVFTDPKASEEMVEYLIAIHNAVIKSASPKDQDTYQHFPRNVAKMWAMVPFWAKIEKHKVFSGKSATRTAKNNGISRRIVKILAENQMVTGHDCDWTKWSKQLKNNDGQPVVLTTISGAHIEVAKDFDAAGKSAFFGAGPKPGKGMFELGVLNTALGYKIYTGLDTKKATSTRNGYIFFVDRLFPARLSDIYALIRDIDPSV